LGELRESTLLSVQMRHRIGALEIDVDFEVTKPWTILFGPSGSGKTTILRAIAGLLHPDSAKIKWNDGRLGKSLTLVDTEVGNWTPPHKRGIPFAPQKASLFPHLSVGENMKYGTSGVGIPAEQDGVDELVGKLPGIFQIDHVLERRPAELSGGEAQRVSLARTAMARRSRLLLLDEPFTGLDLSLRDLLIANLLAWQERRATPILSVTHDVAEAFLLDAEVIKISEGRVVEQGPVASVLAAERARLLEQLSPVE
jgi:molybdate transport system ATP-binding protein